ncbi:MAG TPA: hypothetical protein PKO42_00135 [Tenuifilaceae bacterium]|nr:hypothetical protein [Bacteroidales bacterium]HNY08270.1 hypothetical protein [Tenuifilaceae bacterium]HOA10174.1 hypothetical protein [Tenuifilaceae bacterium]HOG72617.1 hypothetical protein [Tenuifilaceae bacterium]HOW21812.1 hypothetical protein [Tenuifilaceae bacterium]
MSWVGLDETCPDTNGTCSTPGGTCPATDGFDDLDNLCGLAKISRPFRA